MARRRALRAGLTAALCVPLLAVACGEPERPPPFGSGAGPGSTAGADGGGILIDGRAPDSPPTCGGDRIRAIVDPPTVYFVIDRSGSMAQELDASGQSKYRAAWRAVGSLLRSIGHRLAYGAAVFPGYGDAECGGAREIFPPLPGDPPGSAPPEQNGPTLQVLLDRFAVQTPAGGTPTRAALEQLASRITALGDRTFVVLATDGAPNCNEELRCESGACIPDLEHHPYMDGVCGEGFSCCDPAQIGEGAGANCIDQHGTVDAVAALSAAGVPTYVLGLPGSETYASVLAALANAGGTARPGETAYYAVSDADALTEALFEIGTGIAIDCELTLEAPPPHRDLVNVYFDGEVVPFEPAQGWDWTSDTALAIRGAACDTLRSGTVVEVQIVYGCRTIVR